MGTIKAVGFCPHCGNKAPQELRFSHEFLTYAFKSDGTKIENEVPAKYFVSTCGTCQEVLLYLHEVEHINDDDFIKADLVWPDEGNLPSTVPESVKRCYEEAASIKRIAPNAFAVQIRRAIEAICDDRGIKQGTLVKRLVELSSKGELPALLSEMSDALRIVGNIGAHSAEQDVKPIYVDAIDGFFRAIIEYVYIAPGKLAEFRTRLGDLK